MMGTNPPAIDEDFYTFTITDGLLIDHTQWIYAKIFQNGDELRRCGANGYKGHESEVFHETTSSTFWGFSRTDHSPVSIVELPRLGELPCFCNWRIQSPQMGNGGHECQPIENLGNTSLDGITILVFAPVACSQSSFETSGDDVVLDRLSDINVSGTAVDVLLQDLLHDIREGLEELPEVSSKEGTSHVQSLLSIVVSVVFVDDADRRFDQLVGDVPKKEGFLQSSVGFCAHMWQELGFQEEFGVDDPLLLDVCLGDSSLSDVVKGVLLALDDLRLLKTWSERLPHIRIIWAIEADSSENLLVSVAVQSSEEDDQRNALANQWDGAVDALVVPGSDRAGCHGSSLAGLDLHREKLWRPIGRLCLGSDLSHPLVFGRWLLLKDIDLVVCHPLLSHDDLL